MPVYVLVSDETERPANHGIIVSPTSYGRRIHEVSLAILK